MANLPQVSRVTTSTCRPRNLNCEPSCIGGICFGGCTAADLRMPIARPMPFSGKCLQPLSRKGYTSLNTPELPDADGGFPPTRQFPLQDLADIRLVELKRSEENTSELPSLMRI